MFRLLVTADLVIADVSIHNPNVFYELGIRHGCGRGTRSCCARRRPRPISRSTCRPIAISSTTTANLAGGVDRARRRASLDAERRSATQGQSGLSAPAGAQAARPRGADAGAARFPGGRRSSRRTAASAATCGCWPRKRRDSSGNRRGLRLVGEAQFRLKAFPGAKETFEALRKSLPDDVHANLRLGTIYQKLAAMRRPISARSCSPAPIWRSGARSAGATRRQGPRRGLFAAGKQCEDAMARRLARRCARGAQARALGSALSRRCARLVPQSVCRRPVGGYYPGVNALAMLKIQSGLAQAAPDTWEAAFEDSDKAARRARRTASLRERESRRR